MSTYVDATAESVAYCQQMAEAIPDLAEPYLNQLQAYLTQKLWHQLTLLLLDFYNNTQKNNQKFQDSNTFLGIYQQVVLKVRSKLNELAVARMASAVAFACLENDPDAAKALLQDKDFTSSSGSQMYTQLYVTSRLTLLELSSSSSATSPDSLASCYARIQENAKRLAELPHEDASTSIMLVNQAHYQASMTYYKQVGPPEAFYEQAILYLNYYESKSTKQEEEEALAVDICLAALVGDGVYNLGQVVTNPVLLKLKGSTQNKWLLELLHGMWAGNVPAYRTLVQQTYAKEIQATPTLANALPALEEKMTLCALLQMVFDTPSAERTLSFADIAGRLEIALDQVEWVVMRAFSVGLLKGSIHQVAQEVHISWMLPRVLDAAQMTELAQRFEQWATTVQTTQSTIQDQHPALLMA